MKSPTVSAGEKPAVGRPARCWFLRWATLESGGRHDAERLDVHVGARQQQALLRDRGRWRDPARQEFAPHLLIGRHGLDRRVVLVGAHEVAAVGAGRAQHRVDVFPDAQRLLFALGQAGMWGALRQHVRCDAVLEILRHDAGGEHPATGLDALREFDLARAEFDGKQRLCILVGHSIPVLVHRSAASHCCGARGRYAGFLTPACVRHTIAGLAISGGANR